VLQPRHLTVVLEVVTRVLVVLQRGRGIGCTEEASVSSVPALREQRWKPTAAQAAHATQSHLHQGENAEEQGTTV
jgi:hypothetical protein